MAMLFIHMGEELVVDESMPEGTQYFIIPNGAMGWSVHETKKEAGKVAKTLCSTHAQSDMGKNLCDALQSLIDDDVYKATIVMDHRSIIDLWVVLKKNLQDGQNNGDLNLNIAGTAEVTSPIPLP